MNRDLPENTARLTQQVMSQTSITAPALARKLGVSKEDIEDWLSGKAEPVAAALKNLQRFADQINKPQSGLQSRAPRVDVPSQNLLGDSRTLLPTIPDESVDLILSDIPYGIGLDDWDVLHKNTNSAYLGQSDAQKNAGKIFQKRGKPINGWSRSDRSMGREYYDWCRSWTDQWLRVLRPGGSVMIFAGRRFAHRAASALEDEGFHLRDTLAWVRPQAVFRAQRLSKIYQKRGWLAAAEHWTGWRVGNLKPVYEPILWCFKPYTHTLVDNMTEHHLGAFNAARFEALTGSNENVLRFGFEPGERGAHDAQKPVKLLEALIELTTGPNHLVLDPFSGSGSTGVAAIRTERQYILMERDSDHSATADDRLRTAATGRANSN